MCHIVVMTTASAHLSEEVHLPQQIAEHGVDVVHLDKNNNRSVREKKRHKDQTVNCSQQEIKPPDHWCASLSSTGSGCCEECKG